VKKKSSNGKRKKSVKSYIPQAKVNLDPLLIENFISMQKVLTSLAVKFDKLEKQISSLLGLFEDSAKTIAEKEINLEIKGNEEKQQEVLNKLKDLLDQNKLIAKGLTLMHEANVNMNLNKDRAIPTPNSFENRNVPNNFTPSKDMKPDEKFSTPEVMSSFKKSKVKEETKEVPSDTSVEFSI
jgi:hypothetical protein